MEKAKVKSVSYEQSDTIEMQGKRKDIEKHLRNGYHVKEDRNGYWVLTKPAKVLVEVEISGETKIINMKNEIVDHYGKTRISKSLVETFSKDVSNGKVNVYVNSNSNYELK